ncbi:lipoyl-protein ligase [Haemophilus influenzae]|uniref:Lipoyl-protein ligase n=1 Tax=Haemophilus influenzae TaxID=727 RepID=A0A2X1RVP1_HAEIF|nr:lipoyl-protein ligase [Haemophilus influenzae]
MNNSLIVRQLGLQDYQEIWHKMQDFTDTRNAETQDEIWLVQHYPVFTQGQAGKPEHLLQRSENPCGAIGSWWANYLSRTWSASDVCAY